MTPGSHNSCIVQGEIAEIRRSSKTYYDAGVKLDLEDFLVGEYAYAKPPPNSRGQAWLYGEIVGEEGPRSYVLKTPHGEVRRNRRHLRPAAPPIGEMQVRPNYVFGSNAAASVPLSSMEPEHPSGIDSNSAEELTITTRTEESQNDQLQGHGDTCSQEEKEPSKHPTKSTLGSTVGPTVTRSGHVVKKPVVFDPSSYDRK